MKIVNPIVTGITTLLLSFPAAAQQLPVITTSSQTRQLPSGSTLVAQPSISSGVSLNIPEGSTLASRAHSINILDYGALCDGHHAHDDAPAFQAAIEAAGYLGIVKFPTGCYIDTTVNVDHAVTIEGPGIAGDFLAITSALYVPNVTAFNVTKPNVTLRNIYVAGNRSSSTSNLFVSFTNAPQSNIENIRCELMNGCVAVSGGFFGRARNIMARNVVRYVFRLMDSSSEMSSSGAVGVDYFIDHFTYDTDTARFATPTIATLWVQDYEALVIQNYDMIYGGQIATVYINPQYTRSGDHLFGRGYFDINETGDSLLIKPEGTAISNRSSVVGAWMATGQNGVHFAGQNAAVDGWTFRSNWFYNYSKNAILIDNNSEAAGTLTVAGNEFSSNGASKNSTYSDIVSLSENPNIYFSITGNSFNNSAKLSSNVVLHNIMLSAKGNSYVAGNDVTFSPASGEKIVGIDFNAHFSPDVPATFSITKGNSAAIGNMTGLLQVYDTKTGGNCLFLLGRDAAVLVSQTQENICVASLAPSEIQIGVAYSSGGYKIIGGFSDIHVVSAMISKVRI